MTEQLPAPTTQVTPSSANQERKRRLVLGVSIGAIVLLVIALVAATWWAVQPQNQIYTQGFRDVAIIFLAVISLIIGAGIVALLYQVTMLTLLMRDEIKPLLESINETMNTVRGTATFMSDNIAQPTIEVMSAFAGVKRVFDSLAGIRSSVKPKQRKE